MTDGQAFDLVPRKLPQGVHGARIDLVEEFRQSPFGRHSPDLQALLDYMRGRSIIGKHFLLLVGPHTKWMLAKFTPGSPLGTQPLPDQVFDTIEEAEWFVFRLRWKELFGEDPEVPE